MFRGQTRGPKLLGARLYSPRKLFHRVLELFPRATRKVGSALTGWQKSRVRGRPRTISMSPKGRKTPR